MLRIIPCTFPFKRCNAKSFLLSTTARHLSSYEGGGIFNKLKSKILPSQDDQYKKQITAMAEAPSWTVSHFHSQIKESTGGWRSMIPGLSSTQTVVQMNAMKKLLEATMDVLGENAGVNQLKEMTKKEKVRLVIDEPLTSLV